MNNFMENDDKDCREFLRGQVWMVTEDQEISKMLVENGDRRTRFNHPYLIITSTSLTHKRVPVIQGIPISSKTTNLSVDDILFQNLSSGPSKILVSQLTTINTKNLVNYMFTVSDAVMEKVDNAIIRRLGLRKYANIDILMDERQYLNPRENRFYKPGMENDHSEEEVETPDDIEDLDEYITEEEAAEIENSDDGE